MLRVGAEQEEQRVWEKDTEPLLQQVEPGLVLAQTAPIWVPVLPVSNLKPPKSKLIKTCGTGRSASA